MQLIWPTNSKTTTTAHLLIINSLLMTTGFIESSVLSAECILPLAVSCLFSNDHKLKWAAEHLIADVYRLEEFTIDTTAALESLQVSKIRLKLIQSRLCFEFVRLAASRDKGVATSKMIDCPKINPKDVIPQIRHMSYHLPGYLYQGMKEIESFFFFYRFLFAINLTPVLNFSFCFYFLVLQVQI